MLSALSRRMYKLSAVVYEKKINMKGEIRLGVLSEVEWKQIKEIMASKWWVSCIMKTRNCRTAFYLGFFFHYFTVLLFMICMRIMLKLIVLLIVYVYVWFFVKIDFSCICYLYHLYQLGTRKQAMISIIWKHFPNNMTLLICCWNIRPSTLYYLSHLIPWWMISSAGPSPGTLNKQVASSGAQSSEKYGKSVCFHKHTHNS